MSVNEKSLLNVLNHLRDITIPTKHRQYTEIVFMEAFYIWIKNERGFALNFWELGSHTNFSIIAMSFMRSKFQEDRITSVSITNSGSLHRFIHKSILSLKKHV